MTKQITRYLSVLLTVLMVPGIITALPFSASAKEKSDSGAARKILCGDPQPEQLLWGDVDGSVGITIDDASAIQKYAIDLPVGSFMVKAADVNGDRKISILDVTCVQKYIAEFTNGTGKTGQPYDGDKTFTTKSVPVLRSNLESAETAALRFYDDQPNVPYINVEGFYDQFYLVNTDLTDGMTCTRDGGRYTLTNIAGNRGVFDIDADTIDIDNFEKFSYTASTLKGIIAIEKNGDCL